MECASGRFSRVARACARPQARQAPGADDVERDGVVRREVRQRQVGLVDPRWQREGPPVNITVDVEQLIGTADQRQWCSGLTSVARRIRTQRCRHRRFHAGRRRAQGTLGNGVHGVGRRALEVRDQA